MHIGKWELPGKAVELLVAVPNTATATLNCVTVAALLPVDTCRPLVARLSMAVAPLALHNVRACAPESQQVPGIAQSHAGLAGAWGLDTIPLQVRALLRAQQLRPVCYPACHHHMR